MANANEILRLFNVPMSMAAQRQQEADQRRAILSGGGREAEVESAVVDLENLGGLFGWTRPESEGMQRARAMEEAMKGIDYNDPKSLQAARQAISAVSPESGMAFDSFIMNRIAQQRALQAKDLEMAIQAQEHAKAMQGGGLAENKMTDAMAKDVAAALAKRGIITEEQAPFIAQSIQFEGLARGGSLDQILGRLGLGGAAAPDAFAGVESAPAPELPTPQPSQAGQQRSGR